MPSVDEKLLAQSEDSADRAGKFRESKRENKDSEVEGDEESSPSFNQKIQSAKRQKGEKIKKQKISSISSAKIAIAQFLRFSWVSLIKSFGLTLIYINIHWFFSQIFPSFFCKLGEEWFLRPGVQGNPAKQKIVKEAGKKVGLVEKMGISCLNISCFFILIISLAPIVLMLEILGDPFGFIKEVGKAVLGWIWDTSTGWLSRDDI